MSTGGMISMWTILGLVWGGFFVCVLLLVRRDARERSSSDRNET